MTEHQRETAFLRRLIHLDDTAEQLRLDESIAQVQRNQCCIQRALFLLSLFAAVGALVFAYGVALEENFPHGRFYPLARIIGELGFALLIPILALLIQWTICRAKLNRLREECRRMVETLLLPDLENPCTTPTRSRRKLAGDVIDGNRFSACLHTSRQDLLHTDNKPPTVQATDGI